MPVANIRTNTGKLVFIEENTFDFADFDVLLIFSDVIFNSNSTKAVLECSKIRGKLNGASYYYLLKKIQNKWVIHKSIPLTIS